MGHWMYREKQITFLSITGFVRITFYSPLFLKSTKNRQGMDNNHLHKNERKLHT